MSMIDPSIATLGASIGVSFARELSGWIKRVILRRQQRYKAIILPTGKTEAVKRLASLSTGDNTMMVDLENEALATTVDSVKKAFISMELDSAFPQRNHLFNMACKQYVKVIKSVYNKKDVIFVCSTRELAEFIGVPQENIFTYVSSTDFDGVIMKDMTQLDGNEYSKIRLQAIRHAGTAIEVFGSYDELMTMIKSRYKLSNRL